MKYQTELLIFDLKSIRDRISLIRLRYAEHLSVDDAAFYLQVEEKLESDIQALK